MSKTKSWFFEEIKELTNPHPMRYKAEEKNVQTNRDKQDITTDNEDIQRIIKTYIQSPYSASLKTLFSFYFLRHNAQVPPYHNKTSTAASCVFYRSSLLALPSFFAMSQPPT